MREILLPELETLAAEDVLMLAWKKTSSYLRQHSWYADTLEIDYQSLRIPQFIRKLQRRLEHPESWEPRPLYFVPAPKGQSWRLHNGAWRPAPKEKVRKKIRPLAHIALEDQVLATAMLLCLSDKVETGLGNPLERIDDPAARRKVLAYGHRLFCDTSGAWMRHRWGSSKLYRLYFRDYQTFLRRPELVADQLESSAPSASRKRNREVAVVQSDLSKFYDRVRPKMLHQKAGALLNSRNDRDFLSLFRRLFDWRWEDAKRAQAYADIHGINGFESVALPQGLVAAGFFANVALRDFDKALREAFDEAIDGAGRFILKDACYYVDDLRLVLLVDPGAKEGDIEAAVQCWLQELLNEQAPGLMVESAKTKATVRGRQKRFLVPQSQTAKRIQNDVSGVFDMLHGTELIGAIEGFFHTQKHYSSNSREVPAGHSGLLLGISDMRDDTASRFAAGRFRRTFRSLRPLLLSESWCDEKRGSSAETAAESSPRRLVLSREQLDDKAKFFAAMLLDEWVSNPGNVRLLRIALDLYPDPAFLRQILDLLQPCWRSDGGSRGAIREIQQYCLAEVFRAGATETGVVADDDCLPSGIDLSEYHACLTQEAQDLLDASLVPRGVSKRFPWYLLQQALLYLATRTALPDLAGMKVHGNRSQLVRYVRLTRFAKGSLPSLPSERAIWMVLTRSAFDLSEVFDRAAKRSMSQKLLRWLALISPEAAKAAWSLVRDAATDGLLRMASSLGLEWKAQAGQTVLADVSRMEPNPFWQEVNLLRLAEGLLAISRTHWPEVLTPWQVACDLCPPEGPRFAEVQAGTVMLTQAPPQAEHLFTVPAWCDTPEDRRRIQLGMLLRFALRGSIDFYGSASSRQSRGPRYCPPISHWERQRYSTFQGRSAFGPDWIPLSSWTEDFLFDLLRWPGCGMASSPVPLKTWRERLRARLATLEEALGGATGLTFLEQAAGWPTTPPAKWERPLRVGIAQSVVPNMDDFNQRHNDPQLLLDPSFRIRQRRHISSLLEGVVQMLQVRDTHHVQKRDDGRTIDILVFPELAIHPQDIRPLILPFVRAHKCIVLFGQVYHPVGPDPAAPLINSCVWAIPEWRPTTGFQVRFVEQGKEHLTDAESRFTPGPVPFRPVQWVIDYKWKSGKNVPPVRMSASVCFDATDLALAADLKSRSDLYFVCALNRDVGTFDRMSDGLHYHMYQGVIVVNNGQFGGSSFYMPFNRPFERQVFHLHGQPQATVAFAEIKPLKLIARPHQLPADEPPGEWKTPPAN